MNITFESSSISTILGSRIACHSQACAMDDAEENIQLANAQRNMETVSSYKPSVSIYHSRRMIRPVGGIAFSDDCCR